MSKEIHTVVTSEGKRYRVWSDSIDCYVSDILTEEQLRLFSVLMDIEASIRGIFYEPRLNVLSTTQWIDRGEILKEWKKQQKFPMWTKKQKEEYTKMVKEQKDLLLQAVNLWEKFCLEGTV